ncbi:MAG: anaerobic ribonucleoside-triphosphate reductase [Desulfurobacteriaceae bacterium]
MKGNKYFKLIDLFIENDDISRNNANFVRGIPVLEHVVVGEVMKDYLFDEIYKGLPVRTHHEEGWAYHHQTYRLSAYCIGLSAKDIAFYGLQSNAKNERKAAPPKRLETLFMQCANLICLIAQEVSGATSLNDLSTVAAGYLYYLEKEGKKSYSDYDLENLWQEFLYNINLPFRSGNSPFSNITLDFGKPNSRLKYEPVVYAGQLLDITYNQIPSHYFDRINTAFIKAMRRGDADGNPFTFPLITVNITEDFDRNNPAWKLLLKESEYFGGFYVQNYLREPFTKPSKYKEKNPYIKPFDEGMIYSNCCRMLFNISQVEAVTGSNPFHSGSGVGGIGVYAINMNRLLFLAKDDFDFLKRMIDYTMEVGAKALQRKREWLRKHWNDLFPYLSFYQKDDRSLFNIFSVVGVHEGMINAGFKGGLFNEDAKEYAHRIAQYLYTKLQEFMERDRVLYSLEYAPSENAACRMAEKDLSFAKAVAEVLNGERKPDISKDPFLNLFIKEAITKFGEELFERVEVEDEREAQDVC